MADFETIYLESGLAGLGQPKFDPSINVFQVLDTAGDGILAGTFPDGITTIEGEPTPAEVRVLYRPESGHPGDGTVVAITHSAPDGTWRVEGLNPNLKFDVVGRKSGFNDVIMADIRPYSGSVILLSGGFEVVKPDRNRLSGGITVSGGVAPYSVTVFGTAPEGIQFAYVNGMVEAAGETLEWGDFDFTLRVTDANGVWAEVPVELISVDGQWDKVVALLHFDGDLVDEKGLEWERDPSLTTFEVIHPVFGLASLHSIGKGLGVYRGNPINDPTAEFTIEGFIRVESLLPPAANGSVRTALYGQSQNTGNGEFGLYFQHSPDPVVALDLRGGTAGLNFTSEEFVTVLGQVYHFSHTYDGTAHRVFIDGVMVIETAQTFGWKNTTQPFRWGALYLPNYVTARVGADALFDELRITKGIARYTEDFTPPKGPF